MKVKFSVIYVTIALLGTSVGTYVNHQQVNLAQFFVLILFLYLIINGGIFTLPSVAVKPFFWFITALTPGTLKYLLEGNSSIVVVQQLFGITIYWLAAWLFFQQQKFLIANIYNVYIRCAKIAAYFAIFQGIGYLIKIEYLYDFRWMLIGVGDLDISGSFLRTHSFFTEPSYLAIFLMPALYFSVLRITKASYFLDMKYSIIFIIAILSTFSTIGYIGIFFCAIYSMQKNVRNILILSGLIVILILIAASSPTILSRFTSLVNINENGVNGDENLSVFINALNYNITKNIFIENPIVGLGIGSYRVHSIPVLENFIAGNDTLTARIKDQYELLTLTDGGSMYLRLLAEIGLFGILYFFLKIFKYKYKHICIHDKHIANSALIFIIIYSIRSGQLVRFDFIFFCALYFLITIRIKTFRIKNDRKYYT